MDKNKGKPHGIIIPVQGFSQERVQSLQDLPNEEWRKISIGGLNYYVSSYGRIKNERRVITDSPSNGEVRIRTYNPKIMKGIMDKYGYLKIDLNHHLLAVHRLVCKCFFGDSNLEVNHINGDKTDNRLENLEYCTRSENQKHAFAVGLNKSTLSVLGIATKSAAIANRKVSIKQEMDIYHLYSTGKYTYKELSQKFGIDSSSIGRIYRKIKKAKKGL